MKQSNVKKGPKYQNKSDPKKPQELTAHFAYNLSLLVGCTAHITTCENQISKVYEGVFTSFSPNCEFMLQEAHLVESSNSEINTHFDVLIIPTEKVVSVFFQDVDGNYATRDFSTDSGIAANSRNSVSGNKELTPWDSSDDVPTDLDLEADSANGWEASDMFRKNEQKYGVKSTFKEDLSGYTTIVDTDAESFKEHEEQALQIAQEIEKNPSSKDRSRLEDNENEEEAFSAVSRGYRHPVNHNNNGNNNLMKNHVYTGGHNADISPSSSSSNNNGKYVCPSKRSQPNHSGMVNQHPGPSHHGAGSQSQGMHSNSSANCRKPQYERSHGKPSYPNNASSHNNERRNYRQSPQHQYGNPGSPRIDEGLNSRGIPSKHTHRRGSKADLKDFHSNFKLQTNGSKSESDRMIPASNVAGRNQSNPSQQNLIRPRGPENQTMGIINSNASPMSNSTNNSCTNPPQMNQTIVPSPNSSSMPTVMNANNNVQKNLPSPGNNNNNNRVNITPKINPSNNSKRRSPDVIREENKHSGPERLLISSKDKVNETSFAAVATSKSVPLENNKSSISSSSSGAKIINNAQDKEEKLTSKPLSDSARNESPPSSVPVASIETGHVVSPSESKEGSENGDAKNKRFQFNPNAKEFSPANPAKNARSPSTPPRTPSTPAAATTPQVYMVSQFPYPPPPPPAHGQSNVTPSNIAPSNGNTPRHAYRKAMAGPRNDIMPQIPMQNQPMIAQPNTTQVIQCQQMLRVVPPGMLSVYSPSEAGGGTPLPPPIPATYITNGATPPNASGHPQNTPSNTHSAPSPRSMIPTSGQGYNQGAGNPQAPPPMGYIPFPPAVPVIGVGSYVPPIWYAPVQQGETGFYSNLSYSPLTQHHA